MWQGFVSGVLVLALFLSLSLPPSWFNGVVKEDTFVSSNLPSFPLSIIL